MKTQILNFGKVNNSEAAPAKSGTKKQRRRKKGKLMTPFYIVLLLFIVAGALYFCLTMLFNVDRITVEGCTLYDTAEIIKTSGIGKGDNLFQVDTKYAEDKLFSVYNYVEKAEVKKNFPNGITIKITEAEPFAAVEDADGYTLISAGGKVLERGLEELPEGKMAVRGLSTIGSSEEDIKRLELLNTISAAMKSLNMTGYNFLDLTDTLEIAMIYQDRVKVELGNELELPYKLQFVDEVVRDKIEPTGFILVDASTAGKITTREMTVSPWDTIERSVGAGFSDEDEE